MAISPSLVLSKNVPERIYIILDTAGVATLDLVEIADPITGTPLVVLDADLDPIVFPLALTQTPGNDLSWYSEEIIIQTVGEYIAQFSPDIGDDFTVPVEVGAGSGVPVAGITTCVISGNIIDAEGNPIENISVSARILSTPYINTGAGVSGDIVVEKTDSDGYFEFTILRTAVVDVIIPYISYRRTIVVPDQATADLFSLA